MTVLSEQDRKRLMQWVLDRGDARGLGDLVEAIVARHVAEAWPCDNFTRPVTCIGAKVSETARCSFCAAALAEAEQKGARGVVAGVRSWCAINEIAVPPLDWEGLGEFLTRTTTPPEPHGGTQ